MALCARWGDLGPSSRSLTAQTAGSVETYARILFGARRVKTLPIGSSDLPRAQSADAWTPSALSQLVAGVEALDTAEVITLRQWAQIGMSMVPPKSENACRSQWKRMKELGAVSLRPRARQGQGKRRGQGVGWRFVGEGEGSSTKQDTPHSAITRPGKGVRGASQAQVDDGPLEFAPPRPRSVWSSPSKTEMSD